LISFACSLSRRFTFIGFQISFLSLIFLKLTCITELEIRYPFRSWISSKSEMQARERSFFAKNPYMEFIASLILFYPSERVKLAAAHPACEPTAIVIRLYSVICSSPQQSCGVFDKNHMSNSEELFNTACVFIFCKPDGDQFHVTDYELLEYKKAALPFGYMYI